MVLRSVFWWGSSVTMSVLKATVKVVPAARAGAGRHVDAAGMLATSRATSSRIGDAFLIEFALLRAARVWCVAAMRSRTMPAIRPPDIADTIRLSRTFAGGGASRALASRALSQDELAPPRPAQELPVARDHLTARHRDPAGPRRP